MTITLNHPRDHYPWFFGAAVEDRDQSSSIVWAGDKSYRTSQLQGKIKVSQSRDHYPWFFGAAVEDGDQSSSIVWAGDQPYRIPPLHSKIDNTVAVIYGQGTILTGPLHNNVT